MKRLPWEDITGPLGPPQAAPAAQLPQGEFIRGMTHAGEKVMHITEALNELLDRLGTADETTNALMRRIEALEAVVLDDE